MWLVITIIFFIVQIFFIIMDTFDVKRAKTWRIFVSLGMVIPLIPLQKLIYSWFNIKEYLTILIAGLISMAYAYLLKKLCVYIKMRMSRIK